MWRLAASCGRAALVAAAPAPGPFRSEIARRHAGGPRLSRPHPRRVPFRSEVARRHAGGPRLSRPYPRRARSEVKSRGVMREGRACRGRTRAASRSEAKSRGVMREGRACRGRTRAGPVRTPYAEPPPPLCLRFQCVIKSRLLPEPPSPKASSPRQSDMVGRKVRKAVADFAASAVPLSPRLLGSDGKSG